MLQKGGEVGGLLGQRSHQCGAPQSSSTLTPFSLPVCVCLFPSHAPLSFGQLSVPLAKICFAFVLIYFIAKCIFDFDFQLQVEDGVGDLNEVFFLHVFGVS